MGIWLLWESGYRGRLTDMHRKRGVPRTRYPAVAARIHGTPFVIRLRLYLVSISPSSLSSPASAQRCELTSHHPPNASWKQSSGSAAFASDTPLALVDVATNIGKGSMLNRAAAALSW